MRCPACGTPSGPESNFCDQCGAALRRERAEEPTADRRVVTALFADLVDYVRMVAEHDPEDVKQRVDAALGLMADAVHRFGGSIEKFIGDAVFAVFGSPTAHDDDALRAALAAAAIRDGLARVPGAGEPLQVRIGLATGGVLATRPASAGSAGSAGIALTGPAVTTAARIQDLAGPGEILLDEATLRGARERIDVDDRGLQVLRGQGVATHIYALRGDVSVLRSWGPPHGRFIGRTNERAQVRAAFESVRRTRRGRVVVVSGEPGMGKSRLLADLEGEAHRAGVRWTWVDNVSYATGEPYRFLRAFAQELANEQGTDSGSLVRTLLFTANVTPEIARRMAGAVAAVARDAAFSGWEAEAVLAPTDPDDVGEGVLEVARVYLRRLAEVLGPRVIVIDDLQWVDRSSLPAIEQLVRLTTELPFLVLIGTRSTGAAPWLDLPHVVVLRLDGLGPDETEELAAHVAGVAVQVDEAARLHERTGGNPLFIRELVRAQLDEVGSLRGGRLAIEASLDADRVPLTLRTVLGARIDALANADRATLHVASVVGMTFDASSLRRLSTERADRRTFDRLAHAGMLIAVDGVERWRFAHPLIREVAYAGLLASRRRALHAGIADLLEADTPSDLGPIAWHRAAAGDRERGVPMLVRAAEDAEALGALAEAAGYWEAAADLAVGDERALGWREHAAALQSDGREPARAGD